MNDKSLAFNCIKITQPIGEYFIGAIKASDLCEITTYDFRRLVIEEGFATYLGIQRKVSPKRVKELNKYVRTSDACFPTSVILAIPGQCAEYDNKKSILTLKPYIDSEDDANSIDYDEIAVVLDGQHRIAGLKDSEYETDFEINVSIFIDIDIADQAYIFSTVNLAQTKVNKSLVYDLFDLAKKRSPQKTCHNIAVALDREDTSPFHHRIKRLGSSTEGRFNETITQATFVQALLKYISKDAVEDRNIYLNNSKPKIVNADVSQSLIFRNMFIEEKDLEITDVIWNFFDAIKTKWPNAWETAAKGNMLNKTNGFKALMRFLRNLYLHISSPGNVPTTNDFSKIISKIDMKDDDFNTDEYKPGSAGEGRLYQDLISKAGID